MVHMALIKIPKNIIRNLLKDCQTGYYSFLKWDNYYIGSVISESSISSECQFAEMNGGSIVASVGYDKCNTQGKGQ